MTSSGSTERQDRISVLNLNLRFGLAEDGLHGWDRRRHAFPELLRKYRADFMTFQEANDFQVDYIQEILPEYRHIGVRRPASPYWQNNVIFFRQTWACCREKRFFLSPTPEIPSRYSDSRWPRQCTLGIFRKGNQEIVCTTTHFDFDPAVQKRSARLIRERLDRFPPETSCLLTGDFNAPPTASCYQELTRPDDGIPFENAFSPAFPDTFHGFTGRGRGAPIDWILYRGPLEAASASVIREAFDGVYPSDHFPLYAVFRWTSQ